MSELKFTCPACGQHMQCEKAYMGDVTSCPSCNAELRVPFSHKPVEYKTQLPAAELICIPLETKAAPNRANSPAAEFSMPAIKSSADKGRNMCGSAKSTYFCPVCHSELRAPTRNKGGETPIAELVNRPDVNRTSPKGNEVDEAKKAGAIVEKERQLTAARESNPVQAYPAMKPRLSYILTGGESVAPKESPLKTEPQKDRPLPHQDSFAE